MKNDSLYRLHQGIFDIHIIKSLYPKMDLSQNIYTNICSVLQENQKQLSIFKELTFRDRETQILMIYGTEDLVYRLNQFKLFLEKYQNLE